MTGYASATGAVQGWSWTWELRSVNGKGLDLRLRVPDWVAGLEPALRGRLQEVAARGSLTLSLRLTRAEDAADALDRPALQEALAQIRAVEHLAASSGRELAAVRATDVLALQGAAPPLSEAETAALRDALLRHFDRAVAPAFAASRGAEGQALNAILSARIDDIADLVARAGAAAAARRSGQGDALAAAVARIGAEIRVDPDRLAQELALIWVRQDVTEELDRLAAHVAAARDLVAADGPKGRRLDFLMQEVNREANTLCAKSQDSDLTALGLDLKTTIDQLREQVQNVE